MMKRLAVVSLFALSACAGLKKQGKITQFVNPAIQPSTIKRISLIGDGRDRANSQIISRARTRLTEAGIELIVRKGSWETSEMARNEICEQRPHAEDNVDAVAFVGWDHITLHDCKTKTVATDINGGYAGVDALVDKLIAYIGAKPAAN
jgi:hypothetical protein